MVVASLSCMHGSGNGILMEIMHAMTCARKLVKAALRFNLRQFPRLTIYLHAKVHVHALCSLTGAHELPKENEIYASCQVPSQSKFIGHYIPYKETTISLFKTIYV